MKTLLAAAALLATIGAASAHETTYNVVTTWYEPQTQPRNTIFEGSFIYDEHAMTVTGLTGRLSESMTDTNGMPIDAAHMVWIDLTHQVLPSWRDAALGGTFAAVFRNNSTATFLGNTWTPEDGVTWGGLRAGALTMPGFSVAGPNPGNAYALIFVPDAPTAALTASQLAKLAYADCVPTAPGGMMMGGGMMGSACMTGTAAAGYGDIGTMGGYPLSQTITAAVPEPGTYAMLLGGIALLSLKLRRRQA